MGLYPKTRSEELHHVLKGLDEVVTTQHFTDRKTAYHYRQRNPNQL